MDIQGWKSASEVFLASLRVVITDGDYELVPHSMEISVQAEALEKLTDYVAGWWRKELGDSWDGTGVPIARLQMARLYGESSYGGSVAVTAIRAWETAHGLELEVDIDNRSGDTWTDKISYRGDYTILWKSED